MAFIIVVWFSWLVLMALDAKRWSLSHMPEALNYAGAVLIPIGLSQTNIPAEAYLLLLSRWTRRTCKTCPLDRRDPVRESDSE